MSKCKAAEEETYLYKNRDFYPPDINVKYTEENVLYSKKGAICTLHSLNRDQTVYVNGIKYHVSYVSDKVAYLKLYIGNPYPDAYAYYNESINKWELGSKV